MNYFRKYFELTAWILALTLLAFMDPTTDPLYSLCPLKFIGFKFCPGCGLGHSISYLFRGNLKASFECHPLGLFALIIIGTRIYKLSSLHIFSHLKKIDYGNKQYL
ncbi:MAG TPA: DUF2752 domain-containing protein [Hanamia sp.]|nr:DUF2752 domain-containing protein [Hanamia sp.]